MVRARIVAVIIIGVLLLSALAPGTSVATVPAQPVNVSPYDGAVDIMTTTKLSFTYSDNHPLSALWLQIAVDNQTLTDGSYAHTVFDTGPIEADSALDLEVIPLGALQPSTKYYWHVKAMDELGYWSVWSVGTSLTTVKGYAPDQPENYSPTDGATEISPDQRLWGTGFYDCEGNGHFASQWQVTSSAGEYGSPLFDSGIDLNNKTQIAMPVGLVDYGMKYYWRVRYQDDMGLWSAWSNETSFTIVGNRAPSSPQNLSPAHQATGVETTLVLQASDFSDSDATAYVALTDSQAASQWQIRTSTGGYDSPKWNKVVTGAATSVAVPGEADLLAGTPYYWHVRYQDSLGNWSGYSAETLFTTKGVAVPVAAFTADKTEAVADQDLITFTDNSTPVGEIATWDWDFGDGTTERWDGDSRPPNGEIPHTYTAGGSYTVTLTVKNGAAPLGVATTVVITVHEKPEASFTLTPAAPKAGKEITFTDTSTAIDDIGSWEWQFDDGTTETWTAANRPDDRQITHKFKKGGEHAVSLIVKGKGDLGETIYNKKINVRGAGGFQFGLWMVAVGVGVVVVVAGAVYLLRARKGK